VRKYLSLFTILMILLSGCSKSDNSGGLIKIFKETEYPSVVLTINPSIELFYDTDYNVVSCEYINEDAKDAWSDIDATGKNVSDALEELITVAKEKEYLNYDNKDIQITLTKEDPALQETISQMIDEYVEASETSVIVNLEQIDENNNSVVLSTAEKDIDALTVENISGIWVSEEWVNPSIDLKWYNPNYTRTLVFMEDNTGVEALYVSENGANFAGEERTFYDAFSWALDGWIRFDYYSHEENAGNCAYKDLFDDLIVINWSSSTTSGTAYKYEIRNGKLYQYNSDTEYIVYHKVDSFTEPYVGHHFSPNSFQHMNSMDYTNPKATYNELVATKTIYFNGTDYRNGNGVKFKKNGNVYTWVNEW